MTWSSRLKASLGTYSKLKRVILGERSACRSNEQYSDWALAAWGQQGSVDVMLNESSHKRGMDKLRAEYEYSIRFLDSASSSAVSS